MRHWTVTAAAITLLATVAAASADEIKQVPYPEVKVQVPELFKPDAGFLRMQKTLYDAVEKKNTQAVSFLVGPNFVWTQDSAISGQFDYGGDALQNFKVAFGFRAAGKHADGGVKDGPYWESLYDFADNKDFQKVNDTLVCGPVAATVADFDGALSTVMALLPGSSVNSSTSIAAAEPAAVLLLSSIAVSLRTFFCAIRLSGLIWREAE